MADPKVSHVMGVEVERFKEIMGSMTEEQVRMLRDMVLYHERWLEKFNNALDGVSDWLE